jgi:transcriptional regulator with XRE-family HTH domain
MPSGRPPNLARRQLVMQLRADGLSMSEIARQLDVTHQAISHIFRAIRKPPKVLSLPCRKCRASIVSPAILPRDRGKALCLDCLSGTPQVTLAIRLVSLRLARKLTVSELSLRAGVSSGVIYQIEKWSHGTTWRTVVKLAKVLGHELILPLE